MTDKQYDIHDENLVHAQDHLTEDGVRTHCGLEGDWIGKSGELYVYELEHSTSQFKISRRRDQITCMICAAAL